MWYSKLLPVILIASGMQQCLTIFSPEYRGRLNNNMGGAVEVLHSVVNHTSSRCLLLFVNDGGYSDGDILIMQHAQMAFSSVAVFEVKRVEWDYNQTTPTLSRMIAQARQLRLQSWCVTVAVVTNDSAFLDAFGKGSLRGRLLEWTTRLVVLIGLQIQEARNVLEMNYTFSNMNAIIITLDDIRLKNRFGIYCNLPYTEDGARFLRIASWSPKFGISFPSFSNLQLFPEKYWNFHGATINVTATTYKPLWIEKEEQNADGTVAIHRSGMDYFLLVAIAKKLNFHFEVFPITYWSEALDLTSQRKSFMTPVYHAVLHHRLERFDYTVGYTYAFISFSMAKPKLITNWLSLYYPLTDRVWILTLSLLVTVPFVLHMVMLYGSDRMEAMLFHESVQTTIATLLAQSVTKRLPKKNSGRVLMMAWLLTAFVIGAAYQSSLIAALTLPRYPMRPESIEELVKATDEVTIMTWGADFVDYFKSSGSPLFMRLADILVVGVDTIEGLRKTLQRRQAHLETIHKMQQDIAQHFTLEDGSSPLYIGRESIMPALAAWPIPHDAPYTLQLDFCLGAAVEAGLYKKWTEDMMTLAREESRTRKTSTRLQSKEDTLEIEPVDPTSEKMRSLKLTQLLGPVLILSLGLTAGTVALFTEIHINSYSKASSNM